jgi:cytoskeletal protein CcmA (bactofilin family)
MFRKSAVHQEPKSKTDESMAAVDRNADVKTRAVQVQHSILSADTTLTGDLQSKGDITVEGTIDGNIDCRCLTLSGEPVIKGSAKAETAVVSGTFTGDIRAKRVILTKTAKMQGGIFNEILEIQRGADFRGNVGRLESEKTTTGEPTFTDKANGSTPLVNRQKPAA